MAFKTCGRFCKVQGHVSKSTGSIPSRLALLFRGQDKLADTQTLPPRSFNILAVLQKSSDVPTITCIDSRAPPRVYSNKKIEDII